MKKWVIRTTLPNGGYSYLDNDDNFVVDFYNIRKFTQEEANDCLKQNSYLSLWYGEAVCEEIVRAEKALDI